MSMLVPTVLIAAAVVYHTVPASSGVSFLFGPVMYALSVWVAVVLAFVASLVVIELLALIAGGVAKLLLP